MNAAAMSRDEMKPRPPDGRGIGIVLAVLVHLLLIAALAFGVNWRTHDPEGVIAELWSAVPQVAAPRAVAPPPAPTPTPTPTPAPAPTPAPPPPKPPAPVERAAPEAPPVADAQIAIEKARREEARQKAAQEEQRRQEQKREEQRQEARREEAQRQEAQRQEARRQEAQREEQQLTAQRQKAAREKAAADEARRVQVAKEAEERRKKELAEQARREEATLAAQREAYLQRIKGQAGATGGETSTGTAARSSGPSAGYAGRIRARIKPNIVFTDTVSGNPIATVEVRCAPDGKIVSRKLVKSSGSSAWDDSVLRAIDRTEMLPRDTDGSVPPVMQIDFRPRD